jgi:hypothetical protein
MVRGGMAPWPLNVRTNQRTRSKCIVAGFLTKGECIITTSSERLEIRERNKESSKHLRFEVFTAVTMKNRVFWDVTPWGGG